VAACQQDLSQPQAIPVVVGARRHCLLRQSECSGNIILAQGDFRGQSVQLAAVSATYLPNHWYRLEVDWGANGTITGKLLDSNGITVLKTVTATTTATITITAG